MAHGHGGKRQTPVIPITETTGGHGVFSLAGMALLIRGDCQSRCCLVGTSHPCVGFFQGEDGRVRFSSSCARWPQAHRSRPSGGLLQGSRPSSRTPPTRNENRCCCYDCRDHCCCDMTTTDCRGHCCSRNRHATPGTSGPPFFFARCHAVRLLPDCSHPG